MPKDIVCGKTVSPKTPFKIKYYERPYYFCSRDHLFDFAENPFPYVDKSHSASSLAGTPKKLGSGRVVRSRG